MAMLRKHLYRTLIKLGSKFDQNPRMKAFIFTGEARFPEFDENEREMKEDIHMEDVDTAMKEIIESICAPGSFYKPEVSLKEIVRISFRASPSKALDDNARNQLGFMAIRLLNNCEKLATELTYKGPTGGQAVQLHSRGEPLISAEINVALPLDASHIVTAASEGAITDYFQETDELKAGVLLVSHPLCVKYPISNAVCLVTHVSDDHSAGILLNKEFHVTFKSMLAKLERIRYGHYLKPFYDMPCFIGGEYEFDTHLNFCILHTQDSLAHLSHKIPLSGAIDIDTFFTPAVATQQDASASSVAVAAEPVADSVAQGSAQSAGAGAGESANYVYMSHDFASIGKELLSGNISETDLKIVQGVTYWTEGELREEVARHKYFPVRTSAAAHIVMTALAPTKQVDEYTGLEQWRDRTVWLSGQHAWAKLLYNMGGEYRDLARIDRIATAEEGSLYMSILRNMLGYGQRPAVYSGDFSAIGGGRGGDGGAGGFLDDIDSDFEEELMAQIGEVVSLVDEEGNLTGELLITKSPLLDPGTDDDFHDYDDSDDDGSDGDNL